MSLPPNSAEQIFSNVSFNDIKEPINENYINLISNDGYEFLIKQDYAFKSTTIKSMIEGQGSFVEKKSRAIVFHEIPSHIMEKICEYFLYKHHFSTLPCDTIPEFPIPPEISLELLMIANFLDC